MRTYFKLCLSVFVTVSIISCSSDSTETIIKSKSVELKFENSDLSAKYSDYITYSVNIVSFSPLMIESDELEVLEIVHSETNKTAYVIIEKEKVENKLNSKVGMGCTSIKRGYWYDGEDCFVYGTIITDDNCNQLFIPASAATQVLMNDCGWSNVAYNYSDFISIFRQASKLC